MEASRIHLPALRPPRPHIRSLLWLRPSFRRHTTLTSIRCTMAEWASTILHTCRCTPTRNQRARMVTHSNGATFRPVRRTHHTCLPNRSHRTTSRIHNHNTTAVVVVATVEAEAVGVAHAVVVVAVQRTNTRTCMVRADVNRITTPNTTHKTSLLLSLGTALPPQPLPPLLPL